MKKKNTLLLLIGLGGMSWSISAWAQINPNGNPGDWTSDLGGAQPLTTYATGGPNNNGYTEIQDVPNAYGYGYGTGGYSFFGAPSGSYSVSSPFTQSIDVYINKGWASGSIPSQDGLWIDMAPNSSDPNLYPNTATDFDLGEHNFRITSDGAGTVNVGIDGNGTLASITQSGWYDFQMTYTAGLTPTSQVETTMTIVDDATSSILGSTTVGDDSPSSALQSQYLDGSGYVWLPVWAPNVLVDGQDVEQPFAGGVLDVANVDVTGVSAVPEPTTIIAGASMLLPFGASALRMLRKRQTA